MKERKSKKYKTYSIKEKNQIVLLYLDRHMSYYQITEKYGLSSSGTLSSWLKQYREFGTCVDRRGQGVVNEGKKRGRPRKYIEPLEELTKKDLIEKVRMYQEIKKSLVYLMKQQSNNTIK